MSNSGRKPSPPWSNGRSCPSRCGSPGDVWSVAWFFFTAGRGNFSSQLVQRSTTVGYVSPLLRLDDRFGLAYVRVLHGRPVFAELCVVHVCESSSDLAKLFLEFPRLVTCLIFLMLCPIALESFKSGQLGFLSCRVRGCLTLRLGFASWTQANFHVVR